jgi:hypothetical protein
MTLLLDKIERRYFEKKELEGGRRKDRISQ